jgi:hypothetical protein
MQDGGHRAAVLIFLCTCSGRHEKNENGFGAGPTAGRKIFSPDGLPSLARQKKLKPNKTLRPKRGSGVQVLLFPADSPRLARKNRGDGHFARTAAVAAEILQASSASWRIARFACADAKRRQGPSRNDFRSESGCAAIGCCVSSKPLSGEFFGRSAAKFGFVNSSAMSRVASYA